MESTYGTLPAPGQLTAELVREVSLDDAALRELLNPDERDAAPVSWELTLSEAPAQTILEALGKLYFSDDTIEPDPSRVEALMRAIAFQHPKLAALYAWMFWKLFRIDIATERPPGV